MNEPQLELGLDFGPHAAANETNGVVADQPGSAAQKPAVVGAEDELLQRLWSFGAPVRRVVLTENRRTMLSWTGPTRGILRIHKRFGDADPSVIRAVAEFLTFRRSSRRAAALVEIRAFVQRFPAALPVSRRRRIGPRDHLHIERLAAEFERVNGLYFEGNLPAVPIVLSGRMRRRNGHFSTRPLEIVISRTLCMNAEPGEAEHTLRHEMIHLWQHVAGVQLGHGREFRQWARVLDVHPRATRSVVWKEKRTAQGGSPRRPGEPGSAGRDGRHPNARPLA